MDMTQVNRSRETSRPLLGLVIAVPLSLCIWGMLGVVAILAAS